MKLAEMNSLLTDEGYEQARKAGKALSKINFDKIYSSPLVRAAETAKTIKKTLNKEQNIVFDDNLLGPLFRSFPFVLEGIRFEDVTSI